MKIHGLGLVILLSLPGILLAEEAKVVSLSGNVEVRQSREGQWVSASEKMDIAEGGAVRTGADGAVVIILPNKTKVWIKESSTLEVEQRQTLVSRLALVFGKMKIRVPHLLRKEKFEVRTPAAVCAVRGTEFTLETTEDGKMNLQVLFGEVKLKFVVPPEKGASEFNIPQGQGLRMEEKGQASKPALLDRNTERLALENWNPGLKPEERQKDMKTKENDREQIKQYAQVTNNSENSVKSFLNVVKESDLEAGRTLKDVHGNMVRVEQLLVRPTPDAVQFLNIVKRANYTASASAGFGYNGLQNIPNRMDYLSMTMNFSEALPARLEDWAGFFNNDALKATWASFVMANKTDPNKIFFVAEGYRYVGGNDDSLMNYANLVLNNNALTNDEAIMTGVLVNDSNNSALNALNQISNLKVKGEVDAANLGKMTYKNTGTSLDGQVITGAKWASDTSALSYTTVNGTDGDGNSLWTRSAKAYNLGGAADGTGNTIWLTQESYVINNSGAVQTTDDITNSSKDIFSLLGSLAGEVMVSVKDNYYDTGLAKYVPSSGIGSDHFTGYATNIDLVFIPDLMLAAVQRMLPAITNFKD